VELEQRDGPQHSGHAGRTVTPAKFIPAWLQHFVFEKDIGTQAVANEPFPKAYFEKIEKPAPHWDDVNPDLGQFEKAGGKLIRWLKFTRYYVLPIVGHSVAGRLTPAPVFADVVC
jgi:hypothetical protein